ncbi:hypothetical protein CL633_01135 [bacterium]|nr:hypothetical protein [bacterium]|tara:strand:- start:6616 stop:7071 length:456 start_codon:yes stop_codon:yes gene_type:complete
MIKNLSGFSLIEILIIIALIGILAGISFPIWRNASCSADLKNDTREIIAQLRLAQQNTITEQVAYLIRFDDLVNKYELIQNQEIIQAFNLKEDIRFKSINIQDETQEIKFTSIGAPFAFGDITLESISSLCQDKTSQIKITPAGYIYEQSE